MAPQAPLDGTRGSLGRDYIFALWDPLASGWSQASDLDRYPQRLLGDLGDVRKCRGSLEFPRWRISAREMIIASLNSPIPVARSIQTVLCAPGPQCPSTPFFAQMIGGSKFSDEAQGLQGGGNLALAPELVPAEEPQAFSSQPATSSQPR